MKAIELKASVRKETRKKLKTRRKLGYIPAVIYGSNFKTINIEVEYVPFQKAYKIAGENSLIDLIIDREKSFKTLIQDVQLNPLTQNFIHIDFYKVNMDKAITTEIPIEFIGESDAVKTAAGTLVKNYNELEVECLPGALVEKIQVDISRLKTFEDVIKIKDIAIPEGMKVLDDLEQIIVLATPPRSEEEMEALESKVEENVEKIEVVGKKEKEEEAAEATKAEGENKDKKDKDEKK